MKKVIKSITYLDGYGKILPTDPSDNTKVLEKYTEFVEYENVLYAYEFDDTFYDPESADDDAICAWYERNDSYDRIDSEVIYNLKNSIKVIADKLFKCMK